MVNGEVALLGVAGGDEDAQFGERGEVADQVEVQAAEELLVARKGCMGNLVVFDAAKDLLVDKIAAHDRCGLYRRCRAGKSLGELRGALAVPGGANGRVVGRQLGVKRGGHGKKSE